MKPGSSTARQHTANDLFKQRERAWLPRAIVLAVIIHAAVLSLAPDITVAGIADDSLPEMLVTPPVTDLPPPPEELARPAAPVVGDFEMSQEITVTPFDFDTYRPAEITAPVHTGSDARGDFEVFVPSMIAPTVLNARDVERELVRSYPPMLRDAGIGGQVDVHLWLDESGAILRSEIARGSGYDALDAAALKVVQVMKLTPARNRNRAVRVIVTLPVVFVAR